MSDNSWLETLDQRMKKLSEIYNSSYEQDAQNIIDAYDATSEHNIAEPKALAAALRLLIQEHQDYSEAGCGRSVIFCNDLWEIISKLEQKG